MHFTDDQIIEQVKTWISTLQSRNQITRVNFCSCPAHPSHVTILKRFGSWRQLLQLAGIDPEEWFILPDNADKWYFTGVLWSRGSISEDTYLFRSQRQDVTELVARYLSNEKLIQTQSDYKYSLIDASEKQYYQFKVNTRHPYIHELIELGLSGRQDVERDYPDVPHGYLYDFLAGYALGGHWSLEEKRLRLYGVEKLLNMYNLYIHNTLGRNLMSLQRIKNSTIKVLYYQGKYIGEIAEHFHMKRKND